MRRTESAVVTEALGPRPRPTVSSLVRGPSRRHFPLPPWPSLSFGCSALVPATLSSNQHAERRGSAAHVRLASLGWVAQPSRPDPFPPRFPSTLRPPPHRDYLQGHPGIPAYSPPSHAGSASAAPFVLPQDPLITLPHVDRPQATLSGTVEIRWCATPSANGGTPLRAKWLSVELEKIEVIPPEEEGRGRESDGGADSKFVELIGTGPSRLWEAGIGGPANSLRPVLSVSNGSLGPPASRSKKLSNLRGVFSRATSAATGPAVTAHDDPDDDGYGIIPEGNYPFSIPLPEGLPPTVETGEGFSQGISYQIVASLAVKGPKR